ncbi:serine/threonine protein kinase [Tundrisphaera lichenicola]|uniref:serine/threonine protein kinase n=1 Tax=Tundrisphaera lichenicola TaxID=2029860 RepID=UPI003EB8C0D8
MQDSERVTDFLARRGRFMTTGTRRPTDGEEPPSEPEPAPPRLDEGAVEFSPFAEGLNTTVDYQADATILYRGDQAPVDPEDGFPAIDDLTGRTLGQYRMGPVIGWGTMGRVYQAEHEFLCRPCAIKVLNPGLLARQPQVREQFWAEARVVANLVHPHVVTVHNLGSDRNYHFIEMEYVPGGISLKETLIKEGPLDPIRATNLVLQVVKALAAAHDSGLVHRDVKPANVLMTPEGNAKLADFGLVRRHADQGLAGAKVAGTPTYMAPELFAGHPASPRSDLYAVGVLFYYLLSAHLPFSADRISRLIVMHRRKAVPDIRKFVPDLTDDIVEIIARCLAKEPSARFDSSEELIEHLESSISQLRDTEGLLRESVEGLDCFIQGARDHFRILFKLPNDRLQEVYLEVGQNRHNERLLSVFSVCCPAEPLHYEFALKLNAEMTYGGLSIREVNGQDMFVMTRTFPRGHVHPEDVRAALIDIARRSDWVELQLTHADVY